MNHSLFRHSHDLPAHFHGATLAIGNFDGVHRGHLAVLHQARENARAHGRPFGILTFEPHPRLYFRPNDPAFRLSSLRTRLNQLYAAGADFVICQHFDTRFANLSADDFIAQILVRDCHVAAVAVGTDFCFGKNRGGSVITLQQDARFSVLPTEAEQDDDGQTISSSAIRKALRAGNMLRATELLGRAWEIEGRVQHGDKRGRTLNFPTANLTLDDFIEPAYGVYAVRAGIDAGADTKWYHGVANLGIRPMWELQKPLLEVHLFDFNGDLYGQHLRVEMHQWLRGEARFDSLDALIIQMDADALLAREILKELEPFPITA